MKSADLIFMQRAFQLAQLAEKKGEVPVGAVLVFDNEIVGEGWNQPIGLKDPTAHAEITALRDASQALSNYRLPGTTLYVTLEPCLMCVGAMIHARIERLVFGAYDTRTGAVASVFHVLEDPHLNHRIVYEGGVLGEKCERLLRTFFQNRRR